MNSLIGKAALHLGFNGSARYWERRYRLGHTSGTGSYGELASFKAEVLNEFVQNKSIKTVMEFGCGDGHQLSLAKYPRYLGLDVSKTAIGLCRDRFQGDPNKSFLWYDPAVTVNIEAFLRAELTLSLDVIYHLVEDQVYERYLYDLFSTAERHVIVYSSDRTDAVLAPHVRHRRFTADVAANHPNFCLTDVVENRFPEQTFCSFFVFERKDVPA